MCFDWVRRKYEEEMPRTIDAFDIVTFAKKCRNTPAEMKSQQSNRMIKADHKIVHRRAYCHKSVSFDQITKTYCPRQVVSMQK